MNRPAPVVRSTRLPGPSPGPRRALYLALILAVGGGTYAMRWVGQGTSASPQAIQRAAPPAPTPAASGMNARYRDNGDGTVTDTQTRLQWMRCSQGQTWGGGTCSGEVKEVDWEKAKAARATLAGHDDWRLPTIEELRTLVWCSNGKPDYFPSGKDTDTATSKSGCEGVSGKNYVDPTIDAKAFPNTPTVKWFWSSSPYAYYSNYAWVVYFHYGSGDHNSRSYGGAVRLVRGGQ